MHKVIVFFSLLWVLIGFTSAAGDEFQFDIGQTVIKKPLADNVSMDDAVDSLTLRANLLNFKLVAHQPLSSELKAQGVESRRMEIFQFCDARIANEMVLHNIDFAAYLPCRIALIEDEAGHGWLVMLNLDLLIQGADLPSDLHKKALYVRDTLNEIMHAGINGEL